MNTYRKLLVVAGCTPIALAAFACGSDPEPVKATCVDYSAVSGSPSFADDVIPIFQTSCALSSKCHQSGGSAEEDLALGLPSSMTMDSDQITAVHAAIVNVDANRADMKLVVPGDPAGSFLLAKCEYTDFTVCSTVTCSAKGCGGLMPASSNKLDEADLNTLRAWIQDGAKNN